MKSNSYHLRVGVVPEHFSVPFFLGKQQGLFESNVELSEFPRGTGSMCKALSENSIDIAIALTEGLIVDRINNGTHFKIIGTYVESPLTWAYCADFNNSSLTELKDLKGKRIAISRFGSGSHIMSVVLAKQQGWVMNNEGDNDLEFQVKGDLENLLNSICGDDRTADSFCWEQYMLKPSVLQKRVKYIGTIVTPWPCFMIAARDGLSKEIIKVFLSDVIKCCHEFYIQKEISFELMKKRCNLPDEDLKKWVETVKFSENAITVSEEALITTQAVLVEAGVIKSGVKNLNELIDQNIVSLIK